MNGQDVKGLHVKGLHVKGEGTGYEGTGCEGTGCGLCLRSELDSSSKHGILKTNLLVLTKIPLDTKSGTQLAYCYR